MNMIDNEKQDAGDSQAEPETYVAPALEVLGTVAEITRGPDPGVGDAPTGVISF